MLVPNCVISPSDMPKTSKTSKASKKNSGRVRVSPLTPSPPLAVKNRCKLVYSGRIAAAESTAGAGGHTFFRLNGPYDPDTTVLSNATPGLSAIAALYRQMRVYSATVAFDGAIYGPYSSGMVCIVPTAYQPVLPSNPLYWPVQRLAACKHTGPGVPASSNTGIGLSSVSLKKKFTISDVLNVTRQQYLDEADYSSLTSTNPTRQCYAAVAFYVDLSSLAASLYGTVRIEYDIEFFDPIPLQ